MALSYCWRGFVQNCRSYFSTSVGTAPYIYFTAIFNSVDIDANHKTGWPQNVCSIRKFSPVSQRNYQTSVKFRWTEMWMNAEIESSRRCIWLRPHVCYALNFSRITVWCSKTPGLELSQWTPPVLSRIGTKALVSALFCFFTFGTWRIFRYHGASHSFYSSSRGKHDRAVYVVGSV